MVGSEGDAERRYLLREALEANFRSLSSVSIAAPFNALVIALPLWGQAGRERVGGFVLLIAANSALNWWLRAAYLRRRSEAAAEVWARIRVLSAALSGCVWGVGAATLLWVPARLDLQVYALVIVCLTTVGALASSAVFFPAFVAYATCCVAPVVVRFAVERDAPHSATAIELSVLFLVLLVIGRSMSKDGRKRSLLTSENERLIAHLKSAEERLTNANRTLNERVEERTSQLARAVEEKHQSDLQLLRAQKMEAIGRLAGGMAHDFNNVLTAIMGSATLLREMLPERARAERDEADEIIKGADRAARLTSQLLTLARGGQGQAVHVDLNQRLKQLSHLLRRAVGEGMHLELVTGEAQLVVTIDPGQFDQLVMNLVLNAKDASEPGKAILVSIEPGPDPLNEHARRALIRVKDEGSGIAPEVVEHIFEPFFTTKGERGTGLGLSTSFAIVQRAQGLITVDSAPGRGSCFNVSLPIVEHQPESEVSRTSDATRELRLREALVVEDQEAVLRVVARTLNGRGAIVHEARSAEEAIALFESRAPNLDIVISDVLLPQRSGPELIRELKARAYAGPALLISGYIEDEVMVDRATGERLPLLLKPFTPLELTDAVNRALESHTQKRPRLVGRLG